MSDEFKGEGLYVTKEGGQNVLEVDLSRFTLTRRRMLQLLGVGAGAAALAACGQGGDQSGGGSNTPAASGTQGAASNKKGGQINGGTNYQLPPTGHHNFFLPINVIGNDFWSELEALPPAYYLWKDDKYVGYLADKWGFVGNDAFEMTLKPNLKWSNGQPITTKDVFATWTLWRLFNNQLWQFIDRMDVKDEQTISFHMSKPSTVVQHYVLRQPAAARIRSASLFGQWADRLAPLYAAGKDNTSDEVKALRGEFEQFRPNERIASGPYIMDLKTLTEASVEYVKNPSGYGADKARFDKIKLYAGETPVSTPLVLSKEIDFATNGFAVATDRQLQAQRVRVLRTPTHFGPAIQINYARPEMEIWGDKRVRQAVAHAINRETNAAVSLGDSAKAEQYMAGFPDSLVPRWLSEADIAKLNRYPFDLNKAAQLMEAAGCKKGPDGVYVDPKGRRMEYEVKSPAEFQDWSPSSQDWADQMTKFGIKVNVRAVTFTQIPIERREGNFQLAYDSYGTGNPHPHFSLVVSILDKVQPRANGPYTSFNLKQKTDSVGDVDFQQLITDSALGLDVNAQKANITKLALAYNELLPNIPIWERYSNSPALEGTRVAGWPPDGDPIYENTLYNDAYITILIMEGRLGPS